MLTAKTGREDTTVKLGLTDVLESGALSGRLGESAFRRLNTGQGYDAKPEHPKEQRTPIVQRNNADSIPTRPAVGTRRQASPVSPRPLPERSSMLSTSAKTQSASETR